MSYSSSDRVVDELLVLSILTGEQRAVDRLGARWHVRMLKVARHITGNEDLAAEAAQEAWIGICRGWPRLSDPTRFPAWAFGILRRKCIDGIRGKARAGRIFEPVESGIDIATPDQGEDRVAIQEAFAALSPDHRTAAALYFLEGLTLAEVAAATGVPTGTAQSRIFHARRRLKTLLSEEGKEDV